MKKILIILLFSCVSTCSFAQPSYFPIKTKTGEEDVSAFEAEWYGKVFERMKEPSLPEAAKDTKAIIYRFTVLPTWGNPISIRARKQNDVYHLSARRLDGQGGYDPGKLVEQKEVKMSEQDSKTLDTLITGLKFFQMPTNDGVWGRDGDESILEGVSDGKYHVVQRWSAFSHETKYRRLEPFVTLFKFLIDQSNLSQGPKNKGHELLSPN